MVKTAIPGLSEEKIHQEVSDAIYKRGLHYFNKGSVTDISQSHHSIKATVEGSRYDPYHVKIKFDSLGIQSCDCTCPFDDYEWCKHIVAVLLCCLHSSTKIVKKNNISQQLKTLSKDKLCELVEHLIEQDFFLEKKAQLLIDQPDIQNQKSSPRNSMQKQKTTLSPEPYTKEAKHLIRSIDGMRSSDAYWHVPVVIRGLEGIVQKAQQFTENKDGNNAIIILNALTKVYVKDWTLLDGSDGDTGEFFSTLDDAWCEAVLSAELSQDERKSFLKTLKKWQKEIDDYGIDEPFVKTQIALEHYWDHPELQKTLKGDEHQNRKNHEDDVENDCFYSVNSVTKTRIIILKRQQRFEEAMNLALANGLVADSCILMIEQKKIDKAMEYAKKYLKNPQEAFSVAQSLREYDAIEEAISLAELGLDLSGSKTSLGDWLCDLAEIKGNKPLALKSILLAYEDTPSLKRYEKVLNLVKSNKPAEMKEKLLTLLSCSDHEGRIVDKIDIFLKENMLEEAMKIIDKDNYVDDVLLKKVMKAVMFYKPTWVIEKCIKCAKDIIEPGDAQCYQVAVNWLKQAKNAYENINQKPQWKEYLIALKTKHKAKYKLMTLLNANFGDDV